MPTAAWEHGLGDDGGERAGGGSGPASTVLVVDDAPAMRRVVARILAKHGITTLEADNGVQGLAVARDRRPDLVLVDLEMPELDGYGFLEAASAVEALTGVPVIVVTGTSLQGTDAATCLTLGAHDFIRKPFEEPELVARVHAALRARTLQERLRRRNEDLEVFAARAAHDLKSPLGVIKWYATRIADRELAPQQARELSERIASVADRGAAMIADLLDFARQDWVAEHEPVVADPEAAVRAAIERAELRDTVLRIGGVWLPVRMAPPEFASVIFNLAVNAGRYGRDQSGTLRLAVTSRAADEWVEIVFEDSGPGVSGDRAVDLFTPFRLAENGSGGDLRSTGLGLSLARRALRRHGGDIVLETSEGGGARFRISLVAAAH